MKFAAAFLMFVWGTLIVQPSFAYFGGKSAYRKCSNIVTEKLACSKTNSAGSSCSKIKVEKTPCSKKKCNKPSKSDGKDNCGSEGCNPTLGCSSGNFFVHSHHQIMLPSWFEQRQKLIAVDDNRIVKNMSECWHPPEA